LVLFHTITPNSILAYFLSYLTNLPKTTPNQKYFEKNLIYSIFFITLFVIQSLTFKGHKKMKKDKIIGFKDTSEFSLALDEWAAKQNRTKSNLIRQWIQEKYEEELKQYKKNGVINAVRTTK
jgi:hypothetical protein